MEQQHKWKDISDDRQQCQICELIRDESNKNLTFEVADRTKFVAVDANYSDPTPEVKDARDCLGKPYWAYTGSNELDYFGDDLSEVAALLNLAESDGLICSSDNPQV